MIKSIVGQYGQALKKHGGLREALRAYGPVRLVDTVLRTGWEAVGMRILTLLGRRPNRPYGWLEAVLSPTCYYWFRYATVMAELNKLAPSGKVRLIEVASGGNGGMAWALGRRDTGICLVDRSPELLADPRGRGALRVCADACRLPFPDDSFDAAVSLDTVEHLPRSARPIFVEELKRVSKRGVIITCPLASADNLFQAEKSDRGLSAMISERRGVQPGWLQEHLQQGHPTREDLLAALPGAEVHGADNCDAWLRFAKIQQRIFLWVFAGVYYLLFLRKQDAAPPYRQAFLRWQKPMVKPNPATPEGTSAVAISSASAQARPAEVQVTTGQ